MERRFDEIDRLYACMHAWMDGWMGFGSVTPSFFAISSQVVWVDLVYRPAKEQE
jgi:hypothetical protein